MGKLIRYNEHIYLDPTKISGVYQFNTSFGSQRCIIVDSQEIITDLTIEEILSKGSACSLKTLEGSAETIQNAE